MNFSLLQNYFIEHDNYLGLIIFIIVAFAVFKTVLYFLISRLYRLAKRTKNKFDESLMKGLKEIRWPFLLLLPLWLAIKYAGLPLWLNKTFDTIIILITAWTVARVINTIIQEAVASASNDRLNGQSIAHFLSSAVKVLIGLLSLILILSNFGLNINSLLAGLGVGGLIFAFAAQNMLIDSFSALAILLDKSFQVGDFIKIGTDQGWVQQIGLRTTRLQAPDGQQIIISNRAFAANSVHNFTRKKDHLIKFSLKLDPKTTATQCRTALKLIKEAISSVEYARFGQAHFSTFGADALIFDIIYSLEGQDCKRYGDVQQNINFKIKRGLEQSGIKIVY